MNYKKILPVAVLLLGTACERIPAGYMGVKVNLYGSEKGVAETALGVGRYFAGWNTEIYTFPTFLQNHAWDRQHQITMQTTEGLSIQTAAGITYSIRPENVVKVFQKYRLGIDEITDTFLYNMVRDSMNAVSSTMTIEHIYGSQKEIFISKVNELVKAQAILNGIDVEKIYLIGSLQLPDSVVSSINLKIEASQNAMKVENEVATVRAEAQKTVVEAEAKARRAVIEAEAEAKKVIVEGEATARQILVTGEAQAKANKLLVQSLTSEFIQYQSILKWNGALPTTTTGGAVPFINLTPRQ